MVRLSIALVLVCWGCNAPPTQVAGTNSIINCLTTADCQRDSPARSQQVIEDVHAIYEGIQRAHDHPVSNRRQISPVGSDR